jgi:hypothetical protein
MLLQPVITARIKVETDDQRKKKIKNINIDINKSSGRMVPCTTHDKGDEITNMFPVTKNSHSKSQASSSVFQPTNLDQL